MKSTGRSTHVYSREHACERSRCACAVQCGGGRSGEYAPAPSSLPGARERPSAASTSAGGTVIRPCLKHITLTATQCRTAPSGSGAADAARARAAALLVPASSRAPGGVQRPSPDAAPPGPAPVSDPDGGDAVSPGTTGVWIVESVPGAGVSASTVFDRLPCFGLDTKRMKMYTCGAARLSAGKTGGVWRGGAHPFLVPRADAHPDLVLCEHRDLADEAVVRR
jgi:hypothetical protein